MFCNHPNVGDCEGVVVAAGWRHEDAKVAVECLDSALHSVLGVVRKVETGSCRDKDVGVVCPLAVK